jgi:hypothetical protein
MHFLSHDHLGRITTAAGIVVLWLLLAGEVTSIVLGDGLAVAVAALCWVRLIEG